MEQITTRKARLSDLNILLSFEQAIIAAERPFDLTLKEGEIHYYDIAEMIAAPNVEVIVAEINGELIGSAYARIADSKIYLKHPKHAYLGFMYVKPEHRGKGINNRIIEVLKQWVISRGVTEMRLEVYNENLSAIKAYEKAGFTPNLLEMRIGLDKL
ncbi:GNAT family N-acetyltransferase [Mucilaginibacter sp. OK098]|uniref:GNAT family N-acetyltransferase n=1 Tax=Mucilaginibacter sp. OK098 TaxID=1855297 RepID=UPI0009142BB1|nr:GNAT family N-acetyltransferase [Mucilaginibacter sp. OK098]SHN07214.1 Ribosomal protein S18 acetylase RimI [Mucilaginibacter sp. OK098]